MSQPSRLAVEAAFHTDIPMKAYAARIGMSPNTLRCIWKEAHGEAAYRERGRKLQAEAASQVAKSTATSRKYRTVLVPCSTCGAEVSLSTRQTAQMDTSQVQCETCQGKTTPCPVCGMMVEGTRGLSSHLRHSRERGDTIHIAYLGSLEDAKWVGKVAGVDYVKCLACGYRSTTLARHLKAAHALTASEYRSCYGKDALIRCATLTAKRSQAQVDSHAQRGSGKGERKVVPCSRCHFLCEVSKFVPDDTFVCEVCQHKEQEAKWAILSEPEDYVSCRVPGCNYRAESLVSHIQNTHPGLVGRYLEAYPDGHICSLQCDIRIPPATGVVRKRYFTVSDFTPFLDSANRVQVSLASESFGVASLTVRRYCKQLGLPTRNTLALQKEVLDRMAEVLQEDYIWEWSDPHITNPKTGYRFYFDGYFETSNVVVEVHGQQHFEFVPYWHKTRAQFEECCLRDQVKRAAVLNQGKKHFVIRWDEPFRLPGYLRGRWVSFC